MSKSFLSQRHILRFTASMALLTLSSLATNAAKPTDFQLVEKEGHLDVKHGDHIVARYMHAVDQSTPEKLHETYKPYLHVMDETGKAPITKGAGGQFTHHRGIFFGYAKIKHEGTLYDLWHMRGVQQVHQEFDDLTANGDRATFTSLVHWNDKEGQPLLVERRKFTFTKPKANGLAHITLNTELKAPKGDVVLNGDPEHAGVQFRPANEVDRNEAIYYFPGKDADPKKDRDFPWVGQTFSLNGKKYSVVMLNAPENPDNTIFSAYRDYGRFGAFPVGTVTAEKPFTLEYEWLISNGPMLSPEEIAVAYNAAFIEKIKPGPVTVVPAKAKKKKK